jgi:hypothetical protein
MNSGTCFYGSQIFSHFPSSSYSSLPTYSSLPYSSLLALSSPIASDSSCSSRGFSMCCGN